MNGNMKTVADINWRCRCGDWKIETWTKFKYYRPDHIVEDVQFEPALCSKCGEEMDLSTVKGGDRKTSRYWSGRYQIR